MDSFSLSRNGPTLESPARRVIRAFGAARCGALTQLTTDALRKWDRPLSKGGGGGLVPARYQQIFLDEAARTGVDLRAEDLIALPVHIRAREDVQ